MGTATMEPVITKFPSDLEIARQAQLKHIEEIAFEAGIQEDEVELYGRYKAKVSLDILQRLADRPDGKLICVTAITQIGRAHV